MFVRLAMGSDATIPVFGRKRLEKAI